MTLQHLNMVLPLPCWSHADGCPKRAAAALAAALERAAAAAATAHPWGGNARFRTLRWLQTCVCVCVPVLIATPKKCLAIRANGPFPSTLGSKVGMHIRRLARSMTHGASWERWVNTGTHCGPTQGPTASAPQGPRMCADQSNAGEFSMRHPPSSKTAHLQNPALLTSRTPHSSKTPSQR